MILRGKSGDYHILTLKMVLWNWARGEQLIKTLFMWKHKDDFEEQVTGGKGPIISRAPGREK